ncbi:ankyrin repeat domain-containing protein [Candidatus Regiella endosymbiont of Tuberolachnus salignus]|uniref:ankyrin repeat domain-containing protein n=1 Tax=Candidatus Regiella endosymbiont of Tuberolachnus salignus TaxID=3077956 RepID=UPI0030CB08EA
MSSTSSASSGTVGATSLSSLEQQKEKFENERKKLLAWIASGCPPRENKGIPVTEIDVKEKNPIQTASQSATLSKSLTSQTILQPSIKTEEEKINALFLAVQSGNTNEVKRLITEESVSLFSKKNGNTLAEVASKNEHIDTLKYLLQNDVTISSYYFEALFNAAKTADNELLELLIKNRKRLDDVLNMGYKTIVEVAYEHGHKKFAMDTLEKYYNSADKYKILAKLSNKDPNTIRELFACIKKGNFDEIKRLMIKENVAPNVKDRDGCTIVEVAHKYNCIDIITSLMEENAYIKYGIEQLVFTAIEEGNLHLLKLLVEKVKVDINADNSKALKIAISNIPRSIPHGVDDNDKKMVEFLLESGINPTQNKDASIFDAFNLIGSNMVQLLLTKAKVKTNPDVHDKLGDTILIQAIEKKDLSMIKFLLETVKADPNLRNTFANKLPLIDAIKQGNIEIVQELLTAGANINEPFHSTTPLFEATKKGKLNIIKLLIEKKAELNIRTSHDETALMAAAGNGHLDIVKFLVGAGAEIGATNAFGKSALDYASSKNHSGIAAYLRNAQNFKLA